MTSLHEELLAVSAERLSDVDAIPSLQTANFWHVVCVAELLCWIDGETFPADSHSFGMPILEQKGVTGISVGMTKLADFDGTGTTQAVPWVIDHAAAAHIPADEIGHEIPALELIRRLGTVDIGKTSLIHSFIVQRADAPLTVITEEMHQVDNDEQYRALEQAAKALPMAQFCLVEHSRSSIKSIQHF